MLQLSPKIFSLFPVMDITDSAEYKELSDNQKQLQKIAMGFGLSYRGSKHELKLKILKYKENSTDPNVNINILSKIILFIPLF